MRTGKCTKSTIEGRLSKAYEFMAAAEALLQLGESSPAVIATNFVHAGIAAADVVCCKKLGMHSTSTNHDDARKLLAQADSALASSLSSLLSMKSEAGYGAEPLSGAKLTAAARAARKLLKAAAYG
jgi:hypothetical protein